MTTIDTNQSRVPIWLLWGRSENDLVTLVAVTLSSRRATTYRKVLLSSGKFVTVRIEKSEANHLYDPQVDALWERAYGPERIVEIQTTATEAARGQIDTLRSNYRRLWEAAATTIRNGSLDYLKRVMREMGCLTLDL